MREWALHILDLLENSVRAGATVIRVTVVEDRDADRLTVAVEDNGPGLNVTPEEALDPFYTTKGRKRTGLGLSLFRAAVEEAAGTMQLEQSSLGGLAVRGEMQLSHVDRRPLGDLPATLLTMLLANPEVDLQCVIGTATDATEICASDFMHYKRQRIVR